MTSVWTAFFQTIARTPRQVRLTSYSVPSFPHFQPHIVPHIFSSCVHVRVPDYHRRRGIVLLEEGIHWGKRSVLLEQVSPPRVLHIRVRILGFSIHPSMYSRILLWIGIADVVFVRGVLFGFYQWSFIRQVYRSSCAALTRFTFVFGLFVYVVWAGKDQG